MKRLSFVIIGVGCLLFQSAQATLLFSDGFNYSTGALAGNVNPGSGFTWGVGGSLLTVNSGNLTYTGLQDLGGNELSVVNGAASTITNGFANITSGSIYYSFLLDCTAAPVGSSYLTSLNPGTSSPNGGSDALTMYISSATGGYRLGIRSAGVSATTTPSGSPYLVGTTYLVVMQYDFAATAAYLYLNPTVGGSQPLPTLTLAGSGTVTSIDNVGFKSQSTAGASYLVDNILIGTTWADVVVPVPEPSSFVLAGLGALGLIFARRMRR
jgi:hypothetical protein